MKSIDRLEVVRHQPSAQELLKQAEARLQDALARVVALKAAREARFETFERICLETANEATRRCLERELQRLADEYPDVVRVQGRGYRRHQRGRVRYHSLCGSVEVERFTYRDIAVRNGPTVTPVELGAGLIQGATPAMAFAVAQGFAQMPSRHVEQQFKAMHRAPPSRSTLERLGHGLGGAAKREVIEIETRLRPQEVLPSGAHALAVGLDRTTVPIIEERPPGQPPSTPRKTRKKPYQRRPPHPFDVNYRMAYVGTVTIVDRDGDKLLTRRYAATPEEGPDDLVARVMADIRRAREQAPKLPIVVVQDGAPELWGLMWDAMRASGIRDYEQAIDRYHLNERIAKTLEETEPDESNRKARAEQWHKLLDEATDGIDQIVDWIELEVGRRQRKANAAYWSLLGYINGNQRRMRYATLRRRSLPIASGVTEGACKSLITMRTKRSGQRWYQDGLTAVLTLRAIDQSDRLVPFWRCFSALYRQKVAAA